MPLAAGILMLVFILMPIPASGLTIRLYFDKFQGDSLVMYYTTDENPHMEMDKTIAGTVDAGNKFAVIKLSSELADHIDLYSPCDFFPRPTSPT